MLDADSHSKGFCLKGLWGNFCDHFVDVVGAVSCGKKNCIAAEFPYSSVGSECCFDSTDFAIIFYKSCTFCVKVEFTAHGDDEFPHGIDDCRKSVRSDMGMGVSKDFFVRAIVGKNFQDT